jgi:predicted Zn-dependent protease
MKRILGMGAALVLAASVTGSAFAMTSGGGSSSSSSGASSGMSYSSAEKAVKAKQYRKAISILEKIIRRNPKNVDAMNYLGYSHRQLGEYRKAMIYYKAALKQNADHRGVNEYLGQLFLKTGKLNEAKAQLARLKTICGSGCEEYESLKSSIARYQGS